MIRWFKRWRYRRSARRARELLRREVAIGRCLIDAGHARTAQKIATLLGEAADLLEDESK